MKSILLHIHFDHAQDDRLAVAIDLARAHSGHIGCVQTTPLDTYVVFDPVGGGYPLIGLAEAVAESADAERQRIEARLKGEGVSWDWRAPHGDPAQVLVKCASLADVIVLSRDAAATEVMPGPAPIVADVAVHARPPVLVVAPGCRTFRSDAPIVIAWNGSIEAAHSLRLTLSILRQASNVHLIEVAENESLFPSTEACRYLARHGVSVELHNRPRGDRSIARTLLDAAAEFEPSCLVMGAYGHSRLREMILGGVTRELLAETTIPLLLAH